MKARLHYFRWLNKGKLKEEHKKVVVVGPCVTWTAEETY
jgi:hypothetical protein